GPGDRRPCRAGPAPRGHRPAARHQRPGADPGRPDPAHVLPGRGGRPAPRRGIRLRIPHVAAQPDAGPLPTRAVADLPPTPAAPPGRLTAGIARSTSIPAETGDGARVTAGSGSPFPVR